MMDNMKFAMQVNQRVAYALDTRRLKHKLSAEWEFLNSVAVKHRITGMRFIYTMKQVKITTN